MTLLASTVASVRERRGGDPVQTDQAADTDTTISNPSSHAIKDVSEQPMNIRCTTSGR
jgi:hypothetical protein